MFREMEETKQMTKMRQNYLKMCENSIALFLYILYIHFLNILEGDGLWRGHDPHTCLRPCQNAQTLTVSRAGKGGKVARANL